MEWGRLPGILRIAGKMRMLADTPPEGAAFRAACAAWGWHYDPAGDPVAEQAYYMAFHLPAPARWLHVSLTEGVVRLAVLPLLFWENWDIEFHDSEARYRRARAAFDRKFARALRQAEKRLGPPLRLWTEGDEKLFRKAVWQGRTCLLALQQDDYDVQFGYDINFLIQPYQGTLSEKPELLV